MLSRDMETLLVGVGIGAGLSVAWNLGRDAWRAWRDNQAFRRRLGHIDHVHTDDCPDDCPMGGRA